MITKIRVPAQWRVPSEHKEYETRLATAEFSLGIGPCGKVVTMLEIEMSDELVNIGQHHEDGSCKNFVYRVCDLTGRVEIEYD